MKILFLTFYFEPDLSAGSFRNTSLFNVLKEQVLKKDKIDVITTSPNRYGSYKIEAKHREKITNNIFVYRIKIPKHNSGVLSQIKTFWSFYFQTLKLVRSSEYDLVYASSSRLFTAFLGARIASKKKAKLYLDIRDIFKETILDVYKNRLVRYALNIMLTPIENYTFTKASHINLVSKGFKSYFDKYKTNYSYYTNGIDSIFIDSPKKQIVIKEKKTILYAGNIGEGQGLHIIIPHLAKYFEDKFNFIVIGDGGVKDKLLSELNNLKVINVKLLPPVKRDTLLLEYHKADYLFMHLNKYNAFKRVLPSKLFEYAAINKPIIAGVSGYAAEFIKEHLSNVLSFEPGDIKSIINLLENYTYVNVSREDFIKEFSREKINYKMANSILK